MRSERRTVTRVPVKFIVDIDRVYILQSFKRVSDTIIAGFDLTYT